MAMSTVSIHIFGDVPSSPLVGLLQVLIWCFIILHSSQGSLPFFPFSQIESRFICLIKNLTNVGRTSWLLIEKKQTLKFVLKSFWTWVVRVMVYIHTLGSVLSFVCLKIGPCWCKFCQVNFLMDFMWLSFYEFTVNNSCRLWVYVYTVLFLFPETYFSTLMQDKIHNWRATALTLTSILFIAAIFWFIGTVSQHNRLIIAKSRFTVLFIYRWKCLWEHSDAYDPVLGAKNMFRSIYLEYIYMPRNLHGVSNFY